MTFFGYFQTDKVIATRAAALEASFNNVMIADNDFTIIYMNPAIRKLLQEAESDLQKELPGFNARTLIGQKIDVFHKTPSHQRQILARLTTPHRASIKIGHRAFDLVIVPLQEQGRRNGFAVEWMDAHERLLNRENSAVMSAIHQSMVIIEYSPQGEILTMNEAALKTFGYSRREIIGQNHHIFVGPEIRVKPTYQKFWDDLRAGKAQIRQHKQLGKNGKICWVECSYNPILDESGTVIKIFELATDVTDQNRLLSELKLLIDDNFSEIDLSIERSSTEANSAADAIDQTLKNVQTVTAGAREMADAINQIAQTTEQSRQSADQAYQRAIAIGENTTKLADAARAMNGIVDLIRNIAGQINLLALNATIEAARAGAAGKGFAVVAAEVKNLANQAGRATEQISSEIDGIQSTSVEVATALDGIRDAISLLRDHVTTTASSVERQSDVTLTMSNSMNNASESVSTLSKNITGITASVAEVRHAVSKTKQAAKVLVR